MDELSADPAWWQVILLYTIIIPIFVTCAILCAPFLMLREMWRAR